MTLKIFYPTTLLVLLGLTSGASANGDMCKSPDAAVSLRCARTVTPAFDAKGQLWLAWSGGGFVYVARSDDKGAGRATKVNPTPLPLDDNGENRPKIALTSGGNIYVSFTIKGDTPYSGVVLFSRSTDNGATFSAPMPVSDEALSTSQRFDALSVAPDGRVFVAWIDKRDGVAAKKAGKIYAGSALYYATSTDDGKSFSRNVKLQNHTCECCRIAMAMEDDGSPALVWRNIFNTNTRDHAVVKIPAQDEAAVVTRVSRDEWALDACPHHGPALSVAAPHIFDVSWFTGGKARKGLFYARSSDGGKTFSDPHGFGDRERGASHPSVLSRGSTVFLAWKELGADQGELFIAESADGGVSWSAPRRVAVTTDASDHPLLLSTGGLVYVSWQTLVDGYRLIPVGTILKDGLK